ncbi:uncharacterized protein LOC133204821 [Saccostrea echinata]|uniref:uncharacterized protein LOC133204821 n=1 Tax=Saccostrea echinata TaxID=191078 RepID=UPI002A7F2224|nr:uncharacterized protein LOC133204821 [Saccostrea echinata]
MLSLSRFIFLVCVLLCESVEAYKEICIGGRELNCQEWKNHMLAEHNRVRKDKNLPPLVWNSRLAKHALEYAQNCSRKHSDPSDRKYDSDLNCYWIGENGWSGYRSSGDQATKAFENERKYWDDKTDKCKFHWTKCGHYKQIISRRTCMLGCGRAKCGENKRRIWCWYATNCRSCESSKKRELIQLLGLRSVDDLYDFERDFRKQDMSTAAPPTRQPPPSQEVTGVMSDESDENKEDRSDSIEII